MPSLLQRWEPKTGKHNSWPIPEMITSLAKRSDSTLLVASHHGLNVFDPRKTTLVRIAAPEADQPANRANDGGTDGKGRFWFGTMRNNVAPMAPIWPSTSRQECSTRSSRDCVSCPWRVASASRTQPAGASIIAECIHAEAMSSDNWRTLL